jgi:fructose-1,6-bisphosphatase class II
MGDDLRTERELSLDFLRVTEAAAIASAKTMGQGDRKFSDHVAVEAMREVMDTVPMRGRVVIGEGERDEAPMLYIGEEVGGGFGVGEEIAESCPEVDIAVDPLEGTNLCALGANNAIAVLAAAERGGLLNAPDIYMDKIVVGPSSRGVVDIDAPVKDNLKNIARRLGRDIEDLTVIVLDRSRHKKLINDVRGRRAYSTHLRWRSFSGDFSGSGGNEHSRVDGNRWCAGRRYHGSGDEVFERRDSGAAGV